MIFAGILFSDERIPDGSEILQLLENSESIKLPDEQKENGLISTDRSGSLRKFDFDGENFTVYKSGKNTVLTNVYGKKIIKKTYDEEHRLLKSEQFSVGSGIKDYAFESEKKYFYQSGSSLLLKTREERRQDKKVVETEYNSDMAVVSVFEFRKIGNEKILEDKKKSFIYDSKGRVKEETFATWFYNDGENGEKNPKDFKLVKTKNVYAYHDELDDKIPPDFEFYEDDVVRQKKVYSSASDYVQTTFFDGNYSVKVFYKNGVKTAEIIYFNNVEQRKRYFD